EPGRARADHGDRLARPSPRGLWLDPALLPRAVHDRDLDLLDRDGVPFLDLEHAGGLAGRGAQPPGELGAVVRPMQLRDRLAEVVAVEEVVPVGDQVAERAAAGAEGNSALHAARALVAKLDEGERTNELAVVADPLAGVALRRVATMVLEEAAQL